jgi:hypothetical protein
MTERQLKAYANRRQGVTAKPSRKTQASKAWKARNPDWWKGRKYVQLLTSALVNGNAKSKVFKDAGMGMDDWMGQLPIDSTQQLPTLDINVLLSDGVELVPVKSWREFDLSLPADVRRFLDPRNFRFVSK